MRMLGKSALAIGVAVALPLAVSPAAASASAIADWEMNESAGYGGTMHDSTSHQIDGNIGEKVQRHEVRGERTGYRFFVEGSNTAKQDRLVTVPDQAALDPGTRTYVVKLGFRTGAGDQNLVQKGQSNTDGGFFKVDMSKGILHCTFKDENGVQRGIGSGVKLNDTKRHIVKCKRKASDVSITVDGGTPRRTTGPTGNINNSTALTIGGKKFCNETTVGCDYFVGVLDRVILKAS